MPQAQPELKKYMEKRVFCQLNGNRKVIGILRGYDVRSNSLGVPGDRVAAFAVLCRVCELGLFGSDAASGRACEIVVAGGLTWHLQVFMNIVLDEAFEEKSGGEKVSIGMVVIRGNSVVMLEALERINDK
ncbi:small nuclear ribonucleoprotein SmG [Penicillium brasilianum]|uniref:Small nuclear ribonucleoprotein G n=1 Tax=Penicillium brasilianum TaxID=104259 RepID=A0A1S9R8C4_PENBI|nr:small nuclear ribonucleoprotein SmG [Penicillium brasilianum]